MTRIKNLPYMKIIRIICLSSIYLFIDLCIYEIFIFYGKSSFFFFIPILVWILVMLGNKIFRYNISEQWNITATIITFSALCIVANLNIVNRVYTRNRFTILTTLTGIFFIGLLMLKRDVYKKEKLVSSRNATNEDLFNLFYINTSKVHEIAMLIDNKIMKTVEREQISEELLRTTSTFSAKTSALSGEASAEKVDNYKKRVYENFDVKTTKSIMLRKLYEVAKNSNNKIQNILPGQLILFKDVELKRRNIDDTVMILNVLQDSKLKNQGNDSIEINMNKMMEKKPENRFESFAAIREAIGKHDFLHMQISDEDREIYQEFTNLIYKSLTSYMSEPRFNTDCAIFISRLEKALTTNLFETMIQKNADVISSVVDCGYRYNNGVNIPNETVGKFLDWFRAATPQSQALVLNNFIAKISDIEVVEPEPELPF